MNQWFTKRNVIIAAVVLVLAAAVVIAAVLQMESKLPAISFDYGGEGLDERESEIIPKVFAFDWKNAPKDPAQNGEDVKNVGYYTVMQWEGPSMQYSGKTIGFSFDSQPDSVKVCIYDQEGEVVSYQADVTDYVFQTPNYSGDFLYLIEGTWEKGTCGYAFWVTIM